MPYTEDLLNKVRTLQTEVLSYEFKRPETRLKLYRDFDDICIKIVADFEPEENDNAQRGNRR